MTVRAPLSFAKKPALKRQTTTSKAGLPERQLFAGRGGWTERTRTFGAEPRSLLIWRLA